MLFKKLCIFLSLLLIASTVVAQHEGKILAAETARFAAMILKDSAALAASVDDGLVYIHSNGLLQDKKDFLISIQQGTLVYQSIEPRDRKLRVYGSTAIINGIVHVKGILNAAPFEVELRYTDVMINKKGWKLANWQSLKTN